MMGSEWAMPGLILVFGEGLVFLGADMFNVDFFLLEAVDLFAQFAHFLA